MAMRNDIRDDRQRRRSPPRQNRRSDERNNPLQPLRQAAFVPPPPIFSGSAFSETELLNEIPKKKFTGRCRLFIGNLPLDLTETELKELFTPHGDISECYLSGKGFAFLRLDTRAHAESAKEALDGKLIKNRQIKVRFAVHGATIKVKELSPAVSNEMLQLTFSAFGDVERAVHIVDEKGKPTGEGIIEFERKSSASEAIAQIKERVFLMTANSRPLQADFLEPKDEEDGLLEKMLQKTHQLVKERELGPRFAAMNSFEYVYGRRWKELYEYENKRRQELEAELREQRRRLDADMEVAYEDYKAELLREELQRRQEELERLDAARRTREMQRQQMMDQMGERWVPPLVDGPMGRPPPTFGGGQRAMGGPFGRSGPGGGMMVPPPYGQGMPRDGGQMDRPDGQRGPSGIQLHQQNGHGPTKLSPPPLHQQSPNGPHDVRKMLQTFNEPMMPGPGGGGLGLFPPPPNNPLDRNAEPCPLSAFANMLNPLMQQPGRGNDEGGMTSSGRSGGQQQPRIPPPPPPLGGMPPPQNMMDFPPPPEKRSRH